MKCLACQTDNKDDSSFCRKCGISFQQLVPWKPSWRWHGRVLGVVYVILIFVYFGLTHFLGKVLPEPYRMRVVSKDVTPWLKK